MTMTPNDPDKPLDARVDRRTFLRISGAVGVAVAAGGVEEILAARRAPAYAQGTKVHLLQWVDFVPEGDVELRRQIAEYNQQTRVEVTLETITANGLQARTTAPTQSGGAPVILLT